ncbi:microtubule-associated protein 1 light chain 3 gamma-like [Mobula birostris]|uniref:microtubule-associated protein 1 light chain 3 gamma-like n=1 Tax=Mobula birostris TaxID=1983395 RepID=UPI003B28BC8D
MAYRVHGNQRFKHQKSFAARKEESALMRSKYPQRVPVIVERYPGEKYLSNLDRNKYLVPHDELMGYFVSVIRNRLALKPNQTFYLVVKKRTLTNMSATIGELDQEFRDSDGFLYFYYASQEMFGTS